MNGEPYWLTLAKREIGITEVPGPESNQRIVEYAACTTLKATTDQIPWCSSFACWCMERAGIPSPKSAKARDWLHWGTKLETPEIGCVCVLSRGIDAESGHVGFYIGQSPTHVQILGGNQRNSVCIMSFPKIMVIQFRNPTQKDMEKIMCEPGDSL